MNKLSIALLLGSPALALAQQAGPSDDSIPEQPIPEITIIGAQGDVTSIPGSATVIGVEDILRFNQSDIQRMIRQVPGVSVQVEDGFGLRPNLSIRGTPTERSAKITLLEDGVLIAPAPYSAPAAYYFPTAGRLNTIEVLKGPAAIDQGPYTIGGAINLVSTPMPDDRAALVDVQAGEDATWRLHANYGDNTGPIGWLVETHQWQSDGFQELDTGDPTGLEKEDYMVKLRWSGDETAVNYNQLDLKLHYATENSDQTYLGLTDQDFRPTPVRRYGLSTLDNIETEHSQVILRHLFRNDRFELRSAVYYNQFERDWFKTERLAIDGSSDAQSFSGVSWFQVVQAINLGESIGSATPEALQGILNGDTTAAGAIQIRSNAREYYSGGAQAELGWSNDWGNTTHRWTAGIRFHTDNEDRLQRNSTYTQIDGQLVLDDLGLLGNAGNAEQNADAIAIWLRDEINFGRLMLSPGLRYEMIEQSRTRWETRPGQTDDPSSRDESNVRDRRSNDTNVLIPGLGFVYELTDSWSTYGGVHKGFSAPSNAPGVDPEESWNYELGVRLASDRTFLDVGLFYTDYDNLVGTCTASSGADCEVGDAFNGDAATVLGLELSATREFYLTDNLRMPLSLSFTHIDAEFDSDIADTDFFGAVSAGDPLPYIPENQGLLTAGLEGGRWGVFGSLNFVDATCVRASCGEFEKTDSSTLFDLSGFFALSEQLTLTATIENLTDAADIVGRTPYGARPNKSRTAMLGIRFAL